MDRFIRLSKEGAWVLLGQAIGIGAGILLVRILTERLSPEQYGQLGLAMTVVGFINQVAIGGLISGIVRIFPVAQQEGDLASFFDGARRTMAKIFIPLLCIALFSGAAFVFTQSAKWAYLCGGSVFAVLSGTNSAFNGIFSVSRRRSLVALHTALDGIIKAFLVLSIPLFGLFPGATVIGLYSGAALAVLISQIYFLRSNFNPTQGGVIDSRRWIRDIWGYSWPMLIGGVCNWGYYASQRWSLELYVSTVEVGRFYALSQIAYTPISALGAFMIAFVSPIVYARAGDGADPARIAESKKLVVRFALVFAATVVTLIFISAKFNSEIAALLVAARYRSISSYMPIVMAAAGLLQLSQMVALRISIDRDMERILPLALVGNGLIIVANLATARIWGMAGLVWSMAMGALLHMTWTVAIVIRGESRGLELQVENQL